MMVTIHAAVGISASLLFCKKVDAGPSKMKTYITTLLLNVALHGFFDFLPHSHLIPSILDIIIALLIPALFIPFVKEKYLILILICYLGSILPDVIDLGVFRVLGFGAFRIFPWHLIEVDSFLNSIYTNQFINVLFDVLAVLACFVLILSKRKDAQLMLCA